MDNFQHDYYSRISSQMSDELGGRFQSVCRTCGEEEFSERYEDANDFFANHAEDGHDVQVVNLAERDAIELE
jgi:hypothetical protein